METGQHIGERPRDFIGKVRQPEGVIVDPVSFVFLLSQRGRGRVFVQSLIVDHRFNFSQPAMHAMLMAAVILSVEIIAKPYRPPDKRIAVTYHWRKLCKMK